jgi:hypothetical protein
MKSNIDRRQKIFEGVLPVVGTKEYYQVIDQLRVNSKNNPWVKDFSKRNWEKVNRSLEAQMLSSCDFITEKTLRHFLAEFNTRAWRYGLRSMSLLFNIFESFFNYRKPEIYFELIEEENYLISYYDFIDYITSKDFNDDKKFIAENLSSDIIYNFNVGKDLEEIKFKAEDGSEFIVAGISIIRRDNEITVAVITGKKGIEEAFANKDELSWDLGNPSKTEMLADFKKSIEKNEIEYVYLDAEKKYTKVLVVCRMDLDTMTTDARYVAVETNLMFNVKTDEIDGFLKTEEEFNGEKEKGAYFTALKGIDNYTAIFEVAKKSLYLPYFFNLHENTIVEETLETPFKKLNVNPLTKRKFKDVLGFKCANKSLYSLNINNIFSPDSIKVRDDFFKIETSGYWKKISLDEIGLDKKGNPIHGRTWVNKNLSWFEAKEEELTIEKKENKYSDINSGYVYILRNPIMEENIFKIGLTRNNVDDRASQLSKTSVPDKFYKMQEWNVKDCFKAEKLIHSKLDKFRIDPRREFFKINFDVALKVVKEVIDQINTK